MMRLLAAIVLMTLAAPAYARQQEQPPPQADEQEPDQITFEEQVVVSASRTEQLLVNAPATVSVITSETIQNAPATNIGDLMRAVPGVNVAQTSARDVNITSRGATSTLSTTQLALVDGRSVYLDFFGMVMWDLIPANPGDIRQIEVIRGPASAVWGANAMNGVVNVITKTPRELAAEAPTSVTIGVGAFDRGIEGRDQDAGLLFYVNGRHARAVDDRWSYKVSAGYFTQDPLPRPVGLIPGNPFGISQQYPPFTNRGTSQPKFDARVDYAYPDGATLTLAGGVAGTEGIVHSGIGPFDVSSASRLGYLTARWSRGGTRAAFFTNLLNGDAANLLTVGPGNQPIGLTFDTQTFDIDLQDVRPIGMRHVLSYGGNYRRNNFDISIAAEGEDRNEGGVYAQDEIFLNQHLRLVLGGRIDAFSSIDGAVFSPRTALLVKPTPEQTFRVSYNRAFRAPSLINNHLQVVIVSPVTLPGSPVPFPLATNAQGNPDLEQETLTAFEVGYTGMLAQRAVVSGAVYWNTTEGAIYFTPVAAYSLANPPPGWPLPPQFVPPGVLTSRFTYLNIGKVKDKGFELGVDSPITNALNAFVNYSHQWRPEAEDLAPGTTVRDINWPAEHRFNAGLNFSQSRVFGNLLVSYSSEAYWQDVLDQRFSGTTDAYTLVNAGVGVRWRDERVVTSLKMINLANTEVMQHIFGDVLRRQVVGEVRVTF